MKYVDPVNMKQDSNTNRDINIKHTESTLTENAEHELTINLNNNNSKNMYIQAQILGKNRET